MKPTFLVLSAFLAFLLVAGCVSHGPPKLLPPPLPESDDFVEVLPRGDHFRDIVKRVTEVHITYGSDGHYSHVVISNPQDVAEAKALLLSSDITPYKDVFGLWDGEPVLSAFDHDRLLFDLRWQYDDRVRILSDRYYDWLGTYHVTAGWRGRYLRFCSRLRNEESKRQN